MNKILVTTTAVIAIFIFVQTAFAAKISVVPPYQAVPKGDNFTVNISVNPEGSEVFGVQYVLQFNNVLMNATSQNKGPFLIQDGITTNVFANEINNTNGVIKYSETRVSVDYGVTNPGVLTTISFQAIAESGTSEFLFDVVKLSDPDINPIPTEISNGTCEIEATEQTPTPFPTPAPTQTSTSGGGSSGNGGASVTPTPTPSPAPTQTPSLTTEPTATSTIILASTPTPLLSSSPSPTTSPTPISMPIAEEERKLPGFEAMFSIITLLAIYLSFKMRKRGNKNE